SPLYSSSLLQPLPHPFLFPYTTLFRSLRWPIPEVIQQLENVLITQVARRAKYLLITTEQGQLLVHLGMSGVLRVVPQGTPANTRSEEHTSELQSRFDLVCRLLLEIN